MSKEYLKLNWEEFEKDSEQLAKKLPKNKYDTILSVSSGGVVLGKIVSDYLNLPLGVIAVKAYEKGEKRMTEEVFIGGVATIGELEGTVLVIDDLVDTGTTLKSLVKDLKKKQKVNYIDVAVLYAKPNRDFEPDYFLREENKWIIFPYEKHEFERMTNDSL